MALCSIEHQESFITGMDGTPDERKISSGNSRWYSNSAYAGTMRISGKYVLESPTLDDARPLLVEMATAEKTSELATVWKPARSLLV